LTKTVTRLEKQVLKLEEEIAQLESRIKNRDTDLANPDTYQDYARWNTLHLEREEWGKELDVLTHKWSDLLTKLQSIKAQFEKIQS
jgi:ATP-binding cassette subfamily F protein 3